jgi:glucan endo-1,3-beta-D-glucosidase
MLPFIALLMKISTTAVYVGFNYGPVFSDGSVKVESDFEGEFDSAKTLISATTLFTSARLYTTIQSGTIDTPTSAIQAAINTNTSLLLGLWASAGQATLANEISALLAAIQQYGTAFTSLVIGVSVGSEDLYRISPTGIANNAGVGTSPTDLVEYISQVRSNLTTTALSTLIGHVDTWTSWVNSSNSAVVSASDFLGMDAYPYFQGTIIDNSNTTFWDAYNQTVGSAQGKSVWITETGWPVSGSDFGQAIPSVLNAETYYHEVGCTAFGKINTWWYTLQDNQPTISSPSFGIVGAGNPPPTTPLFNISLSC